MTTPTTDPQKSGGTCSIPWDQFVAWDLETCPYPVEELGGTRKHRLETQLRSLREREPDLDDEAAVRKACSLHPELSFICCISAIRATKGGSLRRPQSWLASNPSEESEAIRGFLQVAGRFARGTLWVTFNGKRFDVPYLKARIAHHHLSGLIPNNGIFDTYPYKHHPHADLCGLWRMPFTLDGLCDLLGLASPKTDMTGAEVAEAAREGRMNALRGYCEADVVATAQCLQAMPEMLIV